jgi:hypothetical protein
MLDLLSMCMMHNEISIQYNIPFNAILFMQSGTFCGTFPASYQPAGQPHMLEFCFILTTDRRRKDIRWRETFLTS